MISGYVRVSTDPQAVTKSRRARHGRATGGTFDIARRRRLHGGDHGLAGQITGETAEFFGGDDDDFIAAMNRDALRARRWGQAAPAR